MVAGQNLQEIVINNPIFKKNTEYQTFNCNCKKPEINFKEIRDQVS